MPTTEGPNRSDNRSRRLLIRLSAAVGVALVLSLGTLSSNVRRLDSRSETHRVLAEQQADRNRRADAKTREARAKRIEAALKASPNDPKTAFHGALALYRDGENARAGEIALELDERLPNAETAHRLALESLAAAGLLDQALTSAEGLYDAAPNPSESPARLLRWSARAYDANGETERAISMLLQATSHDDSQAEVALDLSAMMGAQGHPELQRHHLVRAIRATERPDLILPFAADWIAVSQDRDDIESFLRLAAEQPGVDSKDFQDLANLLKKAGRDDRAKIILDLSP